jgi:hypothetical protein
MKVKLLMNRHLNRFLQDGNDFFYISPQGTRHRIMKVYIAAGTANNAVQLADKKPLESFENAFKN